MKEIILRDISKSYGEKKVLSHLSLSFAPGHLTCLQGPSGAGKTTLLRLIAGLEKPDAGTLEGIPERIAFVFQEDRLCEDFSAPANVQLVTQKRLSRDLILAHLREIGLPEDSLRQPVREFSGGMKRRTALVRAGCYDADLVILDEPFKGLDEALKSKVIDYVLRYTAGKTVLVVTHEKEEADRLGGRLITLEPFLPPDSGDEPAV